MVRAKHPLLRSRSWAPWVRKHGAGLRLAECFLFVFLVTGFTLLLDRIEGGPHLIWVTNGVLLAYLLLAPRWRWPALLAIGYAAQVAASLLTTHQWAASYVCAALGTAEVAIAALLLRRRSNQLPDFTSRTFLLRFGLYALLAGPVVSGTLFALFAAFWWHAAPLQSFVNWSIIDALGIAVATPACAAVLHTRRMSRANWRPWWWFYPPLLGIVTVLAFALPGAPFISFIYPLLLLILLTFGLGPAAVGILFVAAVGGWYTIHGFGPLVQANHASQFAASTRLQLFIAAGMFMLYMVSVVLERLRKIERRLQKIVALHEQVTENSRDAILLVDLDGYASFVSPAMERMVGWSPEEMREQGGGSGLVHPEDLAELHKALGELRAGAQGAMIEYRIRKRDGLHLWMEASLKALRDPRTGVVTGTLNILRDISERRISQDKLEDAYKAVEALAATDSLTGLANRRQFDQMLTNEWRRGLREQRPLSLLMIDADYFKSYNDEYGHPRGDNCLKQIAKAALGVAARPGDLVARFGGEEFAVIMPNTEIAGALQLGQEICQTMRNRQVPHRANPSGFVTVSVGCATMVPALGLHMVNLIELADEALYEAKRRGRDQACNGNAKADSGTKLLGRGVAQSTLGKSA
jgi:diguanylate cyclase (GGDEF)-like protein/PAS domain S-box-containing protein